MAHFLAPSPLETTPSSSPSSSKSKLFPNILEDEPERYDESLFIGSNRRLNQRRKKKLNGNIGGELVESMKRGFTVRESNKKESRLKVLVSIAGILFLILSTIWILRLKKRIKSKEGGYEILWNLLFHSKPSSSHVTEL
ncbi:uncharacterized protein I206_100316 [Kwoniella pini CBS 10737]|uniref:Transmembrane protein n=1 Tax=Kwoniella pini CBS 10737 TaxID=1296096 RepID=A0A1B9IDT5_9TREE|nr:uncharacterized protein I206_01009 [Kwoniella pini CBS 10737]OCF53703.1 hypothetical protein I206_01009 [Kwoniella pini CBS 10737]